MYIDNVVRDHLKIGLISVLTAVAGQVSLEAIVPDAAIDSYQGIPERNAFGLRPPPSQPQQEPTAAPLPKITLTGITTILDSKRALMKVAASNAKQPDPTKELSLILTEGQREGDIEVLQIDERAGSVKVRNSGTVMVLTFEKDGAKLPATPLPPGSPGAMQSPSALPGVQTTNPYTPPVRSAGTPPPFPGRNPRRTVVPGAATANGAVTYPAGGVPTPTGVAGSNAATPAPAAGQDLTAEEQAIVMELQRQSNPGTAALLPPTPLTPAPAAPQPVESTAPAPTGYPAVPGRPSGLVPQ